MFFPEKLQTIKASDLVLEIGPGVSPYYRSDVLLEKKFSENEMLAQNGNNGILKTDKKIIYYEGSRFPFRDNEFDYVICSHVLEHIPSAEMPEFFSEINRVAKRGYFEYPTIYYEYVYNLKVHVTTLMYKDSKLFFYPKSKCGFEIFLPINNFFYETLAKGHVAGINELKKYFFQGFEWSKPVELVAADKIDDVLMNIDDIEKISFRNSANTFEKAALIKRLKRFIFKKLNK